MTDINPLFAPMSPVIAGEPFTREHALVLQAYHRFGAPILVAGYKPTAAHVNEAVKWWNETVVGGAA